MNDKTQENGILIFSGNSNSFLSKAIAEYLGKGLGGAKVKRFSDGEIIVQVNENVRGSDVFVIQSTCTPVNENIMELLLLIDALKRASAGRITAVIPYYGYGRQDRKVQRRRFQHIVLDEEHVTQRSAGKVIVSREQDRIGHARPLRHLHCDKTRKEARGLVA